MSKDHISFAIFAVACAFGLFVVMDTLWAERRHAVQPHAYEPCNAVAPLRAYEPCNCILDEDS